MHRETDADVTEYKSNRRSTSRRRKFGIVHYVTGAKTSFLVIPSGVGIYIGDRISFYVGNGKVSFRVEKDGTYSVFQASPTSRTMRCVLCPELEDFAYHRVKDIITKHGPDGWTVPLSQFE